MNVTSHSLTTHTTAAFITSLYLSAVDFCLTIAAVSVPAVGGSPPLTTPQVCVRHPAASPLPPAATADTDTARTFSTKDKELFTCLIKKHYTDYVCRRRRGGHMARIDPSPRRAHGSDCISGWVAASTLFDLDVTSSVAFKTVHCELDTLHCICNYFYLFINRQQVR